MIKKPKVPKPKKPPNQKKVNAHELVLLLLNRQADKLKIKLSEKFWNEPTWKTLYQRNIIHAYQCLKRYSYEAMLNALKSKECLWATSFCSILYPFFQREQEKIDIINKMKELDVNSTPMEINKATKFEVFRKSGTESKRNKLKD